MKITKNTLKQIIKEEIDNLLKENLTAQFNGVYPVEGRISVRVLEAGGDPRHVITFSFATNHIGKQRQFITKTIDTVKYFVSQGGSSENKQVAEIPREVLEVAKNKAVELADRHNANII